MSDQIEYRVAKLSALEGKWQPLARACFHPAYLGIGEMYGRVTDVEAKLAQMEHYLSRSTLWTAWAGEELAGLLAGRADEGRLTIYDLMVAPTFRRQGIARRLVELAMAESKASHVATEINQANEASQALFRSLGFRPQMSVDWMTLDVR